MVWLLIGYMWLFIHRPFEVWPALGEMRVELAYMVVTGLVWLLTPGKRWPSNRLIPAFLGLAAVMVVCWLVSPWPEPGLVTLDTYFKTFVFFVLLITVVHDEKDLRRVTLAFLAVMALYMLHSLWEFRNGRIEYRMGITRMLGVDRTLGDANSFAASIVYALPLVTPFWVCYRGPVRAFLVGYVALSGVCVALTGSRSGFVGLVVFAGLTVWQTRWRRTAILASCLTAPLLWAALPPSLQNRFETIINPDVGPANAQASAMGRIQGLELGLGLWAEYPLTGCGPGAWIPATHSPIQSHNLYGQLVGELGTLGLLAFAAVLLGFRRNLRQIRTALRDCPPEESEFLRLLARALGMAVFLLLLEGNFGHNLYRATWLWYGGFLIIIHRCVVQRQQEGIAATSVWQEPAWGTADLAHGAC
jgi:hypothetical protein